MKSARNLVITASILLLSGCTMYDTYSEVDALNEATPVGSPFAQALAGEYKTFANDQLEDTFDYPDALHFARKGLAASSGDAVMPEPVSDWNLAEKHIRELAAARGRLVVTYDLGAREIAPATAALAQVKFDCWIEEQEENWADSELLVCKKDFLKAIAKLEGLVQQAPEVVEEEPAPMVPEEAMYLVFFNWDSSDLSTGATSVIDAVANEIAKNTPEKVTISGHADTSGASDYNEKLALKRAKMVKDALISRGVSPDLVAIESHGENELLVQTSDNVREPANRRVNITFQ